jgi:putative zinc finger/helix-turn-helix YgiT family protein
MEEAAMKCIQCGALLRRGRENVPDRDLPGVILVDVTVNRCPNCGEWSVEIPHHEDLTRALAQLVIEKPGHLTKEEVRYLRSCVGFESATEFARVIGHDASTVSRWENGQQPIGRHAELLLRLMVAHESGLPYPLAKLGEAAVVDTRAPLGARVRFDGRGWVQEDQPKTAPARLPPRAAGKRRAKRKAA